MTNMCYPRPIPVTAVAAALALCIGAGATYAADTSRDTRAAPATSARADLKPEGHERASAIHEVRLSKLIDMDVENADGKEIGEIRDVIVDANNGRVQYAVLEYGGFMGMGEKLFPFPLNMFRTRSEGDELVLDVPEERLRKAPGFERNKWPDWNAPDYRRALDRYYESRDQRVQDARFIRGTELLDADVRAQGGERIGDVEDVVANIASGDISYVVVAFGRGWFSPDKLVALPLRALTPVRERGVWTSDLMVSVDKSRLERAPAFKRDQWPDGNEFGRDVERYWGDAYGFPSAAHGPVTAPQQSRQ